MNNEKLHFLKYDFVPLLEQLAPDTKPKWGVMNAQQMVEHFSTTLRYANGNIRLSLHTPEDILPKARAFMLSEKPFRENTKNPMMGEAPEAIKYNSLQESVAELQEELNAFLQPLKMILYWLLLTLYSENLPMKKIYTCCTSMHNII